MLSRALQKKQLRTWEGETTDANIAGFRTNTPGSYNEKELTAEDICCTIKLLRTENEGTIRVHAPKDGDKLWYWSIDESNVDSNKYLNF